MHIQRLTQARMRVCTVRAQQQLRALMQGPHQQRLATLTRGPLHASQHSARQPCLFVSSLLLTTVELNAQRSSFAG
eukprot:822964-Pelagomonas_calceolata.AAC.2